MSSKETLNDLPTILVSLDTTNASKIALRYACRKAQKSGFAVQILMVIESSYKGMLFVSQAIGKDKRMQVEKHLKILTDEVAKETGIVPSISIREGDIVSEIIREIKSMPNCTMLVLGKSYNSLSDNTVLPKLSKHIGGKIKVPIAIVPECLTEEYLARLV